MNFDMIKKDKEFKYIYHKGNSFANKKLVIYYIKNNTNNLKIGISISKKVGKAVTRNRLRRLIKENIRLNENIKTGYSIILLARIGSDDLDFHTMNSSMNHLFRKCCLTKNEQNKYKGKN